MMKKILLLLILVLCLASCSQQDEGPVTPSSKGNRELHVNVSVPQDVQSRSINPIDEYAIHTLYILTFDSHDKMVGAGAVKLSESVHEVSTNISLSTNIGEMVKVYAVANTNNSTVFNYVETLQEFKNIVTSIARPEDLGEGKVVVNGATLLNDGQLMVSDEVADVEITEETPTVNLTLHNQCAALKFTITPLSPATTNKLVPNPVKIIGYRLRHVPLSAYLMPDNTLGFGANDTISPPYRKFGDFDYVPVNSFEKQEFTYYVFENHCGTSNMSSTELSRIERNAAPNATYLEIEVDQNGTRGVYNFYLGDIVGKDSQGNDIIDYENYNIFRHEDYHINIKIDAVSLDDPRITDKTKPAIGDFLFSDGSWGPYENVSEERHPIALIFMNYTSDIDSRDGYYHGYAMALKNLTEKYKWQNVSSDTPMPNGGSDYNYLAADLDGRDHCIRYMDSEDFPAAYAALHINPEPAPPTTSGWYLPSAGQWYRLFVDMGGAPDTHTNYYWAGYSYTVKDKLHNYLAPLSTDKYDKFEISLSYWTSSEYNASDASEALFYPSGNGYNSNLYWGDPEGKSNAYTVRPVIAF